MTIDSWPSSILEINSLPLDDKEAIYRTLLPDWLFIHYGIDRDTLSAGNLRVVQFRAPSGSRAVEISVKRRADDRDPMLYLNMADTFNNQLLVLLMIIMNPDAPRFNIDVDEVGNPTQFGTIGRNRPAELAAMKAGLSPGQIRAGLRQFKQGLPLFEEFVQRLGHEIYLIEPLAYHNAIAFERYGFNYIRGLQEMKRIHQEFQPEASLCNLLTDDNPFRPLDAWKTIRGRSWAIHDGILGHPFTGFQMYKLIGKEAGINTFPDAQW